MAIASSRKDPKTALSAALARAPKNVTSAKGPSEREGPQPGRDVVAEHKVQGGKEGGTDGSELIHRLIHGSPEYTECL